MNSSFKRILALILMIVSLLSCFTNAYADYSYNATVETTKNGNGGKLNMRESQSTNSNLVVRIPNGTVIKVESLSGTWLHAKYNNYYGYVKAEFILESDVYGNSSGSGSTPILKESFSGFISSITNGSVNIREAPSTNSALVSAITGAVGNTFYTFSGVGSSTAQQEWLAMYYGNEICYVCARYIGLGGYSNCDKKVNASGGLNLRVGPSTSSATICTLSNGTKVQVIDATVSGWCRVVTMQGTGWVASNYLVSL